MTAKRSYDYADYWIEITVQPASGRFEGAAAIFASRESSHGGQLVHNWRLARARPTLPSGASTLVAVRAAARRGASRLDIALERHDHPRRLILSDLTPKEERDEERRHRPRP